jgi:hypothetical protein
MGKIGLQISRGILLGFVIIIPTIIFFAPLFGFHHIIACGVLAPIVLNGETPGGPGDYIWGTYAVRFFPGRFALSLIFWLAAIWILFRLFRKRAPREG